MLIPANTLSSWPAVKDGRNANQEMDGGPVR